MAIDKSKMKCNSPKRQISGGKKFVVKACKGGKEKIIRFGDANMTIKKNIPARRKSFRARHKCSTAKSKLTARYWACKKLWAGKGGSTKSSPQSRQGKY